MSNWISLPETAQLLGLRMTDVRRLISEHQILAIRGDDKVLRLPRRQFGANKPSINKALRGTLVLLTDSGLPASEQWEWLNTVIEEFGKTPLELLEDGSIHPVRRAAILAGI